MKRRTFFQGLLATTAAMLCPSVRASELADNIVPARVAEEIRQIIAKPGNVFTLSYHGTIAKAIAYQASHEEIRSGLEHLSTRESWWIVRKGDNNGR